MCWFLFLLTTIVSHEHYLLINWYMCVQSLLLLLTQQLLGIADFLWLFVFQAPVVQLCEFMQDFLSFLLQLFLQHELLVIGIHLRLLSTIMGADHVLGAAAASSRSFLGC